MSASLVDALWYLGRGTGVVSLVLLTATVVLGVATRSGRPAVGLPRFGVAALHRSTSLMAVLCLIVHVGSLLLDPYAQLSLVDLVVPFQGADRPLWLGFGTLSLDLLLVVVATSLLRTRLPVRVWRWLHLSAYAAWPVAVAHGLGNGTDGSELWFRIVAATCVALVGTAVVWRLTDRFPEHIRPTGRRSAPARTPAMSEGTRR